MVELVATLGSPITIGVSYVVNSSLNAKEHSFVFFHDFFCNRYSPRLTSLISQGSMLGKFS